MKRVAQRYDKYPQLLQNVKLGETSADEIMASKTLHTALLQVEAELGEQDGFCCASGTEPLIRVMIEGRDGEKVRILTQQLASVVEQLASAAPSLPRRAEG